MDAQLYRERAGPRRRRSAASRRRRRRSGSVGSPPSPRMPQGASGSRYSACACMASTETPSLAAAHDTRSSSAPPNLSAAAAIAAAVSAGPLRPAWLRAMS